MFVYSCSMKIHASGFDELLKSIFSILLVVEAFSLKKSCQDAWRSGRQLAKGQVHMEDEAKLCSPICSSFEVLVVQHVVGCYCGEKLGPICWPVLAAGIALFWCINLLYIFLRCNGFAGIQKAVVDQTGNRPPVTITSFCASLALGSTLELLFSLTTELVVASCIKSTFHHTSQSYQEVVHCYCIE